MHAHVPSWHLPNELRLEYNPTIYTHSLLTGRRETRMVSLTGRPVGAAPWEKV